MDRFLDSPPSAAEPAVESLALALPPLADTTPCGQVYELMLERPDYSALAVLDQAGRTLGMVNRTGLLAQYARRFWPDLYNRKPISALMDRQALQVDAATPIDRLAVRVAEERPDALQDGFIILKGGAYFGIGTGLALMRSKVELSQRYAVELLRAREVAERASQAKSEFLAQMSHELRTPLNAILGFSEIFMGELFGALGNQRYREYARDIHDSGAHLLDIINDILDWAKADAGKLELNETWVDLTQMIDGCVRLMRPRADQAGLKLAWSRAKDVPLLNGDQRMLKQIVLNLLSNAVKFTPTGGMVSVGLSESADGELRISVRDTGIGMAPQDLPHALSPFGQLDSGLARVYEGTGLGLPLSNSFAELHGGRLEVESQVGVGTCVTVVLPAARRLLSASVA